MLASVFNILFSELFQRTALEPRWVLHIERAMHFRRRQRRRATPKQANNNSAPPTAERAGNASRSPSSRENATPTSVGSPRAAATDRRTDRQAAHTRSHTAANMAVTRSPKWERRHRLVNAHSLKRAALP